MFISLILLSAIPTLLVLAYLCHTHKCYRLLIPIVFIILYAFSLVQLPSSLTKTDVYQRFSPTATSEGKINWGAMSFMSHILPNSLRNSSLSSETEDPTQEPHNKPYSSSFNVQRTVVGGKNQFQTLPSTGNLTKIGNVDNQFWEKQGLPYLRNAKDRMKKPSDPQSVSSNSPTHSSPALGSRIFLDEGNADHSQDVHQEESPEKSPIEKIMEPSPNLLVKRQTNGYQTDSSLTSNEQTKQPMSQNSLTSGQQTNSPTSAYSQESTQNSGNNQGFSLPDASVPVTSGGGERNAVQSGQNQNYQTGSSQISTLSGNQPVSSSGQSFTLPDNTGGNLGGSLPLKDSIPITSTDDSLGISSASTAVPSGTQEMPVESVQNGISQPNSGQGGATSGNQGLGSQSKTFTLPDSTGEATSGNQDLGSKSKTFTLPDSTGGATSGNQELGSKSKTFTLPDSTGGATSGNQGLGSQSQTYTLPDSTGGSLPTEGQSSALGNESSGTETGGFVLPSGDGESTETGTTSQGGSTQPTSNEALQTDAQSQMSGILEDPESTTGLAENTQAQGQQVFSGQFPPVNPRCKAMPFTPDTWKELRIDDHMKAIPNGQTLSVEQYALQLNYTNFICGIGGTCWAGQPCYPLGLVDFYILYATQQWNFYMNIYSDAIAYAIAVVNSSINALIASLFPATDTYMIDNMRLNLGVQAAFSQVTGAIAIDLFIALGMKTGPIGMALNALGQALVVYMGYQAASIKDPPGPLKDGFDQWSNVAFYLSQYQQMLQSRLNEESKSRLRAGISTEEGMFGILKNGTFLNPSEMVTLPDYEDRLKDLAMTMGVNAILNRANAFVTIWDGCNQQGENGAYGEDNRISYCDKPGGTMYNVVVAKGDKAYAEITNAKMIYKNFGYSPEQITQSSVKCQDLGKGYRYFPWSDGSTMPQSSEDVCMFNLPVCKIEGALLNWVTRGKNRWSLTKACRVHGLPI